MKILVASPKGGVGKSAVSVQVFCPWLSRRAGKKITYIVCDTVNGAMYAGGNPSSFETRVIKGRHDGSLDTEMALDAIDECIDCVVDVGGNLSYASLISALKKQDMLKDFGIIALPTKNDVDDVDGAKSAYDEIISAIGKGTRMIWFLVGAECPVCSADKPEDQEEIQSDFIEFFGDKPVNGFAYCQGGVDGLLPQIPEAHRTWFSLPPSHIEPIAKRYALPIAEMAEKDFSKYEAKKKDLTGEDPASKAERKALRHFLYPFHQARSYTEETLRPIWSELDEICKGLK